jgi:uncharacterized protein
MPEPPRTVVSNTGPFITLEKLPGGFKLLRQLYDRVLLPERVLAELTEGIPAGEGYLKRFGIEDLVEVVEVASTDQDLAALEAGERDALALAIEKGLPVLIEERRGRDLARAKGVKYSGIAGQLIRAGKLDILNAAEVIEGLQGLYRANRINRDLLAELVRSVSEESDGS